MTATEGVWDSSPVHTTLLVCLAATAVLFFASSSMFAKKWDPRDKHCYIGGASEGLGLSLACLLASRGAHVTLVSRSKDKLDKALEQVKSQRSNDKQRFQTFACDLTDDQAAARTMNDACAAFESDAPDAIFACAGGCVPSMFTDMPTAKHVECLEWNFKTALYTIHEGVKRMKESSSSQAQKKRKVVLTGSVLSMMGFAGYSSYAPSKYAIRGLADCLRNELLAYGIDVHLFLPATIYSPGFENEQRLKPELTKKIEGPDEGKTPDQVAAALLRGIEKGQYMITYEPVGHLLRNSRGVTPRNNILLDPLWAFVAGIVFPLWRLFVVDPTARKGVVKQ